MQESKKLSELPFAHYLITKKEGELLEGMQTVFVYYEPYKRYIYAHFSDDFGFFRVYILNERMMDDVDSYIREISKEKAIENDLF